MSLQACDVIDILLNVAYISVKNKVKYDSCKENI